MTDGYMIEKVRMWQSGTPGQWWPEHPSNYRHGESTRPLSRTSTASMGEIDDNEVTTWSEASDQELDKPSGSPRPHGAQPRKENATQREEILALRAQNRVALDDAPNRL
ncbi:hypothetical protein QAD02_008142 [Eretmocerus hayati]|uniref:Uncharacterized protein n=1 Tax=Eretmocerus hayati TaxID=131215 RepID=A0ACC2NA00_9HYME|nr:hypothetical protein QAD02_008142 [Eretmocerus hayati]